MLRDSGCTTIAVKADLVDKSNYLGQMEKVGSFTGETYTLPLAEIDIRTPFYTGRIKAVVVKNLICDLILGNMPALNQCCSE